ncbi:MAG: DUF192 domain-containing protein [Phycisphaerae bacterium]|nr:DUF192 domain-containing protein [Phycisphaerae bacterium]
MLALTFTGCGTDPSMRNDLAALPTARIAINNQTFEVWLATTQEQQRLGLMQVEADELAPIVPDASRGLPDGAHRGMLFVFDDDRLQAFWMYNTITALDIAYIRSDGRIVSTYTMAPLETKLYPSIEPAKFVLEVPAGLLAELGIQRGDHVEIPPAVLKELP